MFQLKVFKNLKGGYFCRILFCSNVFFSKKNTYPNSYLLSVSVSTRLPIFIPFLPGFFRRYETWKVSVPWVEGGGW